MSSRHRTPEELERMSQLRGQAEFLETIAMMGFAAGVLITLVASVVLLNGPRRNLAVASLVCVGIAVVDVVTWTPLFSLSLVSCVVPAAFFMTLLSLIYWPVASRWVNWPLVTGGGVAVVFLTAATVVRPAFI